MYRVKTPVGEFHIREDGDLIEFKPYGSDEEAVRELLQSSGSFQKEAYTIFWEKQEDIFEKAGVDYKEYPGVRRRIALKISDALLRESTGAEDILIGSVEALDDVNRTIGLLYSRLAAWCQSAGRDVDLEEGIELDKLIKALKESSQKPLLNFALQVKNLNQYRAVLEGEIEEYMGKNAPNLSGLAGPILGAKMISRAKGLKRLADMPGSRIQVLGASQAMFRFLKRKGSPPKHGIIYEHPLISKSPHWQRGKIARSFASKLAIAARLDAYSGIDRATELREKLMERVKTVKKSFVEEPKKLRIIKTPKAVRRKKGGRGI